MKIGFSIYLREAISEQTKTRMQKYYQAGFNEVFTSLHIPEEDVTTYRSRITELGALCQALSLDLTVDVSAESLNQIGFSFTEPAALKAIGITGLRIDDGVSEEIIAELSHELFVAVNASTLTPANIAALKANGADFSRMEAWHNYYPRPETGLDDAWFAEKNQWLAQQGFVVMAFVPGDGERRGPLFAGLPTLEGQRKQHPLASTLAMKALGVNKVFIGDPSLSTKTFQQFTAYFQKQTVLLQAELLGTAPSFCQEVLHQRPDVARDVVRITEGRLRCALPVEPTHTVTRAKGTLTVDNKLYGRYQGELQITKVDLPADEKVNVIGRIDERDSALLPYCDSGQAIQLISGGNKDEFR